MSGRPYHLSCSHLRIQLLQYVLNVVVLKDCPKVTTGNKMQCVGSNYAHVSLCPCIATASHSLGQFPHAIQIDDFHTHKALRDVGPVI